MRGGGGMYHSVKIAIFIVGVNSLTNVDAGFLVRHQIRNKFPKTYWQSANELQSINLINYSIIILPKNSTGYVSASPPWSTSSSTTSTTTPPTYATGALW